MTGVLHYKAGNAPSVLNALRHIGEEAVLVTGPGIAVDRLILPGVGSALATMDSLRELGLDSFIRDSIGGGKPFLGICVGLQVLFDRSEEGGDVGCLGIFPGRVRRFDDSAVRVPQMGWNKVDFVRADPLVNDGGYFYFVNSFFAVPDDPDLLLGRADYNGPFCAMASRGKVYGAQFHVEKSGEAGLAMLKRFCTLI
ncbi:MAG: imidazole glycerol phosphate synthase subunit HisH [Oscillospiraceae bacterium]|jgi:glutamine amidotransferase|nr:imidazole glycerol phosphate synthase subunit HisH [Oscillospiraceae bacterium]